MNFERTKGILSTLSLESELGSVHVPQNMERANFLSEGFEYSFRKEDGSDALVRINPSALQDVLLTVNNATLFKSIGRRFFILTKVGNIHLPFYQSLNGTGGKTATIWHPYFGITPDGWIIKGGIDSNRSTGMQEYHPHISEVQNILNENLILQSAAFYSPSGKVGSDLDMKSFEPRTVIFDIHEHLGYKFWGRDEKYRNHPVRGDRQMLVDYTGYDPREITHPDNEADPLRGKKSAQWIREIVGKV